MKNTLNKILNPKNILTLLRQNHYLLSQLILRNIETRYRGSFFGFVWSFIQPLLMLAVYTFVFTYVFQARWGVQFGENRTAFSIIMFAGIACFTIFSESLMNCSSLIISCPNYVKKVLFPLELLPLASVSSTFIVGMVWFLLLFLGSCFFISGLSWTMLYLPLILIPLYILTMGCGLFVASVGVYLRDLPYILGVILQIMFFMTPIFYPISAVPKKIQIILNLNPMSFIVEQVREVFLYRHNPNWYLIGIIWAISFSVFYLGYVWFAKTKKGFADVL